MAFRVRHIATRFALILAAASILPLVAYGVVSLVSLQRGTRESVTAGHLNVATRAAEEIRRDISGHAEILKALAADLQDTGLDRGQQDRMLKNHVLQFRAYREITLFDRNRATVATSRVGEPRAEIPRDPAAMLNDVVMSPIRLDTEDLPVAVFAIHLSRLNQPAGWLVGEISLEEVWRMVDQIRVGSRGYALVVAPDGTLIAHGDPDRKALIAQSGSLANHPLVGGATDAPASQEYVDEDGDRQLAVAARIPSLGWTVIVEQPTSETYANAAALRRQLVVAIVVALLVMIGIGLLFGRRFIAPIFALQRATQAVAGGDLDTRVDIRPGDEFGDLGVAFNRMADRLAELREDVKRQERQAMFGRIAGGLFHDLSHPVQNIGNSTQLLLHGDMDPESRAGFHRTIQRELATVKRFMEDLRNVARPTPIERFALDVNSGVSEVMESMRTEGERVGVVLEGSFDDRTLVIEGDPFALGRVYSNVITNAIQATGPGGRVSISTAHRGPHIEITITDTGSGISPDRLPRIFDDFVTTKRRGLGLGLAISKGIVEQMEGSITVESEVGRGTSFTLRFPARDDLSKRAVAS